MFLRKIFRLFYKKKFYTNPISFLNVNLECLTPFSLSTVGAPNIPRVVISTTWRMLANRAKNWKSIYKRSLSSLDTSVVRADTWPLGRRNLKRNTTRKWVEGNLKPGLAPTPPQKKNPKSPPKKCPNFPPPQPKKLPRRVFPSCINF